MSVRLIIYKPICSTVRSFTESNGDIILANEIHKMWTLNRDNIARGEEKTPKPKGGGFAMLGKLPKQTLMLLLRQIQSHRS